MIIFLSLIGLVCALFAMYLLTDRYQIIRRLKANFKGPGIGEAVDVKGSNMDQSTVKITFSTTQPDGMLYLNYGPVTKGAGAGGGDLDPYIVVYLKQGHLYTFVNSDTSVDQKLSETLVADGKQHTVELSVSVPKALVTSRVDKEDPLSHLFQTGNDVLGTQVLIGDVNKKVRPLQDSLSFFFKPFKGCFYLFELYGQGNLLLSLEDLAYGGQVEKIFYNEEKK